MKWRGEYLGFEVVVSAENEHEAKNRVLERVMEEVRKRLANRVVTIKKIGHENYESNEQDTRAILEPD